MKARSGALSTTDVPTARTAARKRAVPLPLSNEKVARFIAAHRLATPFLVIDLAVIAEKYQELRRTLPMAQVFYAVKANPAPEIIRLLAALGASFDVASRAEIELVRSCGAKPEQISFGNTIKKERDIAFAHEVGVRLFAFDSEAELQKIARSAPGSRVFCRLLTSNEGAEWPLSRKFGCEVGMAYDLLLRARKLRLEPYGVSFHVGSQQTRTDQWDSPLRQAANLFDSLKKVGVPLQMVNVGGGLPARYRDGIEAIDRYATRIMAAMLEGFGSDLPHMIIEPGRSLVGDSGLIETEVILVSKKSHDEHVRWVYLDVGKFGGLAETHDEAIKYRIEAVGKRGKTGPVIIAGPSCDSVDILYEKFKYELPLSLAPGDKLRFHATGAYTASYASVGFNGFAPLTTVCIE